MPSRHDPPSIRLCFAAHVRLRTPFAIRTCTATYGLFASRIPIQTIVARLISWPIVLAVSERERGRDNTTGLMEN